MGLLGCGPTADGVLQPPVRVSAGVRRMVMVRFEPMPPERYDAYDADDEGVLWLRLRPTSAGLTAFGYEFSVREDLRRWGYGRAPFGGSSRCSLSDAQWWWGGMSHSVSRRPCDIGSAARSGAFAADPHQVPMRLASHPRHPRSSSSTCSARLVRMGFVKAPLSHATCEPGRGSVEVATIRRPVRTDHAVCGKRFGIQCWLRLGDLAGAARRDACTPRLYDVLSYT